MSDTHTQSEADMREQIAAEIEAEGDDTEDGYGYETYINGLSRAAEIVRGGR